MGRTEGVRDVDRTIGTLDRGLAALTVVATSAERREDSKGGEQRTQTGNHGGNSIEPTHP